MLQIKDIDQPSVFTPENLLREARRQKNIPAGTIPEICVLDPDGDIRIALVKILNKPQLVLMMFRTIVDLADEQGTFLCEPGGQFIDLARIAEIECSRPDAGSGYWDRQLETVAIMLKRSA